MKLFSKRNSINDVEINHPEWTPFSDQIELIESRTRVRLEEFIRFISSSLDYLEDFALVDDSIRKKHYINDAFLINLLKVSLVIVLQIILIL
jgi:hypothetical protein